MTDREKLGKFILDARCLRTTPLEEADYLIKNGVIVLPCNAGDTVYDIYEALNNGGNDIRALKVTDIHVHFDKRNKAWIIIGGYYFAIDDFGKTVFITREEATNALEWLKQEETD